LTKEKRQEYYRNYRKTYVESPKAKTAHRDANSRTYLRKATKIGALIAGGWPDAGRIEQKVGTGFVTPNQWLRAAWAERQKTPFTLLFARTQEDAIHQHLCETMSFREYAKKLGMLKEWNKLVNTKLEAHSAQEKRK
jgi:hypothetical protein